MKKLVAEELPQIEFKEFDKQYANIAEISYKAQQQAYKDFEAQKEKYTFTRNEDKNKTIGISEKGNMIRFYIELDWDEFYMKFPLMKGLEKEILSIITPKYNKNIFKVPITGYELGEILTSNF